MGKLTLVTEIAYGTTQPIGNGQLALATIRQEWEVEVADAIRARAARRGEADDAAV